MQITRVRCVLPVAFLAATACSPREGDSTDTGVKTVTAARIADAPTASGDPSAADVSHYELTIEKLKKFALVQKMEAAMPGTAADTAAMQALRMGTEPVAESVRKMEAIEPMRRALASAGLEPRDYVMIMVAYLQAGMTDAMLTANPQAKLPEGQSMRNVEFLRSNKAEIEKIMSNPPMQP